MSNREEMLKTLEEKIRKMNREDLLKLNALLDVLEKEYPPEPQEEGEQ